LIIYCYADENKKSQIFIEKYEKIAKDLKRKSEKIEFLLMDIDINSKEITEYLKIEELPLFFLFINEKKFESFSSKDIKEIDNRFND
jgi:thiol-disulfide isomerase/thioredoxin